jgi:hypothetical protein
MKSKRSSPKFSSNSSSILSNKYVLYASFFFAIITAANYLLRNNLEAIGIFIIIGFLTTYFSKNMIVVLLTTTILTNFLVMFRNRGFSSIMMMEGFTAKEIPDLKAVMDAAKTAMDSATDDAKKAELKTKYEEAKKKYDDAVAAVAAAAIEDATASKSTETKPPVAPVTSSETFAMGAQPANTVQQPLGGANVKDGMSQLRPAPVGGESINPMMQAAASGSNAQKEQALSVLSNMGGSGDMVAQQNEMINNLKSIEPILNTAQSFLDKFENSSISKMFSGSGGFPGMSLLTGGAGGSKTSPAPVGN